MKGQPVQFGIPVQFLHLNSNKFLSCNYNEAGTPARLG